MYYNVVSERIAKNLRSDLFNSIIRKDVEFFDSRKSGDLCKPARLMLIVSRLSADTTVITEGLSTNISMFLRAFLFILAAIIYLFVISWELTLLMLACFVPVIIFAGFFGRFMRNAQKLVQERKAVISSVAEEAISNIRTVKAFSTEKEEHIKYEKGNELVFQVEYSKAVMQGVLQFMATFFVTGSMCAVIVLGCKLV